MALKLFKCCTGAGASEGHVGMQVHFGMPCLMEPWESPPHWCVRSCLGSCVTAQGCLNASRSCCLCDRFCAGLIALQTLATPTMCRCRETSLFPSFHFSQCWCFLGMTKRETWKAFIRSSYNGFCVWDTFFNFSFCNSLIGLEKLLKSAPWKVYF